MKRFTPKISLFALSAFAIILIFAQTSKAIGPNDNSFLSPRDPAAGAIITVTAPTTSSSNGSTITVSIMASDTTGLGATGYDMRLMFDPSVIIPVGANFGCSTAGTIFTGNATCNLFPTPNVLAVNVFQITPVVGAGPILNITFNVIGTPGSVSPLNFQFFAFGEGTPASATVNGSVTVLRTTAANVSIEGRVLSAQGAVIPNAIISVFDEKGRIYSGRSNNFGYFRVLNLPAGGTYIITGRAKRYNFPAQAITLNQQVTIFNLIAEQ